MRVSFHMLQVAEAELKLNIALKYLQTDLWGPLTNEEKPFDLDSSGRCQLDED